MRRHLGLLVAGTTALALMLGVAPAVQTAHAEYFEYIATATVDPITGISSIDGNNSSAVTIHTDAGDTLDMTGISSAGVSPWHLSGLGAGTSVSFGQLGVNVNGNPTVPARDIAFNFTYTVTISDYANPAVGDPAEGAGTITVSGMLSGSLGSGRTFNLTNLQNYATDPANGQVTIGNTLYTVSLSPFTPPGFGAPASFGAIITASPVVAVPEPVSMLSTALGFLGVGGLLVRNRRRNQAAVAA